MTEYDRYCELLWAYARFKGLGATEEDLRNTPFKYADTLQAINQGRVTIDVVLGRFSTAVHRHMRRGRRISEAA